MTTLPKQRNVQMTHQGPGNDQYHCHQLLGNPEGGPINKDSPSQTPGRIQKVDPPQGSEIYTIGFFIPELGGFCIIKYCTILYDILLYHTILY